LARAAVDRIGREVDGIISTGICGALIPALEVGDIVVATSVNGAAAAIPCTEKKFTAGPIASVNRVAGKICERQDLRKTGAIAVEMEAAAVAERAQEWGKPFFCVKSVSDVLDQDFVLDLNTARGSDGRFRVSRILAQALQRPFTVMPELLRLSRDGYRAARALGEFFANCSF
jgi:nucleoside phosphorylase